MPAHRGADAVLSESELKLIEAARAVAFTLYEGKQVAHHSCGIALASTFGRATPAYQSLRRGGITGCGMCGALRAGEMILGELLGDPNPTGQVTDALCAAMHWYQAQWRRELKTDSLQDVACNRLVANLGDFRGPARVQFCTDLSARVAALVAEAAIRFAPPAFTLQIRQLEDAVARAESCHATSRDSEEPS